MTFFATLVSTQLLVALYGAIIAAQVSSRDSGLGTHLTEPRTWMLQWALAFALVGFVPGLLAAAVALTRRRVWVIVSISLLAMVVTSQVVRALGRGQSAQLFEGIQSSEPPRDRSAAPTQSDQEAEGRPNLVLITIDTLRPDHLGFMGYSRSTTPFLDSLAERGTVFESAIAQAPMTLGSMASMMTGLLPNMLEETRMGRQVRWPMVPSETATLADRLKDSGYATAAFVSNGYLTQRYGFDRGFDHFDQDSGMWQHQGPSRAIDAQNIVDAGLTYLDEKQPQGPGGNTPVFLWLHFLDPHHPYEAKTIEEWEEGVDQSQFDESYKAMSVDQMTARFLEVGKGEVSLEAGELDYLIGRYDAEIKQTDKALEGLFAALESRGLNAENTLFVITADHGEEFLDHQGMLHSHTLYDELIHVPFLVYGPGFSSDSGGKRVRSQVRLLDVAPTLVEASGGKTEGLQGDSLRCFGTDGGERCNSRPAHSFLSVQQVAYRTDDHKLLVPYELLPVHGPDWRPLKDARALGRLRYGRVKPPIMSKVSLFDLTKDSGETTDQLKDRDPIARSLYREHVRALPFPYQLQQLSDAEDADGTHDKDDEEAQSLRALGYIQ